MTKEQRNFMKKIKKHQVTFEYFLEFIKGSQTIQVPQKGIAELLNRLSAKLKSISNFKENSNANYISENIKKIFKRLDLSDTWNFICAVCENKEYFTTEELERITSQVVNEWIKENEQKKRKHQRHHSDYDNSKYDNLKKEMLKHEIFIRSPKTTKKIVNYLYKQISLQIEESINESEYYTGNGVRVVPQGYIDNRMFKEFVGYILNEKNDACDEILKKESKDILFLAENLFKYQNDDYSRDYRELIELYYKSPYTSKTPEDFMKFYETLFEKNILESLRTQIITGDPEKKVENFEHFKGACLNNFSIGMENCVKYLITEIWDEEDYKKIFTNSSKERKQFTINFSYS